MSHLHLVPPQSDIPREASPLSDRLPSDAPPEAKKRLTPEEMAAMRALANAAVARSYRLPVGDKKK